MILVLTFLFSFSSFAQPKEDPKTKPIESLTVDGEKILIRSSGRWEYAPKAECDSLLQLGYTEDRATTVITQDVLYIKNQPPFKYHVIAFPEQDEKIKINIRNSSAKELC